MLRRPKTLEQSFASHEKAKFWSDKNKLKPINVRLNSHMNFWFDCEECGHEFETNCNRINCNNSWCPYCAHKQLCSNKCDICFKNSFASHITSLCWS